MSGTVTPDPNDPNPALRAELLAAEGVLAPEIRGLHAIRVINATNDPQGVVVSPDLLAVVTQQITVRERRVALLVAVLNALDAVITARDSLEADGYPNLSVAVVDGTLFSEIQGEQSDLQAAIAVFATNQIVAGQMTLTPNPSPPTNPGP
jgi:hypothetical protein